MWTLLAIAFADDADDAAQLAELQSQASAIEASIAAVDQWSTTDLAGQERLDAAQALAKRLQEGAGDTHVALRSLESMLHRVEGDQSTAATALVARFEGLKPTRTAAYERVALDLATTKVELDPVPPNFFALNNLLYTRATTSTDPPDAWLLRPIEAAAANEQWKWLHAWGGFCVSWCSDKAAAEAALAKLPETRFPKDQRWGKLNPQ